ncbi:hypothetical protein D3C71_1567080 [compost metagenome]
MLGRGLEHRDLAAGAFRAQGRDEVGLVRHFIAFMAHQAVAFEEHRELAGLDLQLLALEREHILPAIRMEHAGQQGRAEDVAHLLAAHSGRECLDLFTGHEIALDHFDLVRSDSAGSAGDALARVIEAATGSQDGRDHHSQRQTGTATGLDMHGYGLGDMIKSL